jgi:predicted DNA-binding transcriptional regulator AlpA
MSLNPANMNAPNQITINITGQLTLHCKNVEPVLRALQIQLPAANPLAIKQSSGQSNESSFITEMQLLKKLSISRSTVFTWRMSGKIPTVKLGRRTLYHWPSVEAALLRCQRGGA